MKIIITGATGLVGEGVILACLDHPKVEKILMVNRRHSHLHHQKLEEYILPDFLHGDYDQEILKGYDACFYCAGITSLGMTEEQYTIITYDISYLSEVDNFFVVHGGNCIHKTHWIVEDHFSVPENKHIQGAIFKLNLKLMALII